MREIHGKRDRDRRPRLLLPELGIPDLGCSGQGVVCLWDKAAVGPFTPSPSSPLLPCPLSFSPWPVLMWAPESISQTPSPSSSSSSQPPPFYTPALFIAGPFP